MAFIGDCPCVSYQKICNLSIRWTETRWFQRCLVSLKKSAKRAIGRWLPLAATMDCCRRAPDLSLSAISQPAGSPARREHTDARRRLHSCEALRRSLSSLPGVLLVLSRPMVSAAMIAKAAEVTPRGALNLVAKLGVRKMRGEWISWPECSLDTPCAFDMFKCWPAV